MAVPRNCNCFTLIGLLANQDYDIHISALCFYAGIKTESEKVSLPVTTLPGICQLFTKHLPGSCQVVAR
jgi:hypothetical protein